MLELVFFKVLSHTDTVHVAEDASESAFIRYPVADEIVAGSPQNSVYMYMYITFVHCACYEVMRVWILAVMIWLQARESLGDRELNMISTVTQTNLAMK